MILSYVFSTSGINLATRLNLPGIVHVVVSRILRVPHGSFVFVEIFSIDGSPLDAHAK